MYTYSRVDLAESLKTESQMYVLLWMAVLTFPSGLVWAALFSLLLGLLDSLGVSPRPLLLEVGLMWAGFVVVGFLQWFVYGPVLLTKFRGWRSPNE
jgi:hypothetical protein